MESIIKKFEGVKPLTNRVIIKEVDKPVVEGKGHESLLIVDPSDEKKNLQKYGVVVCMGDLVPFKDNKVKEHVKVGDKVLFDAYGFQTTRFRSTDVLVGHVNSIIFTVE